MSFEVNVIHESLRLLLAAITNASLYGMGHPQVARLAESAYRGILTALDELPEISLVVVEGELVINGEPPIDSLFLNHFADTLDSNRIGHIKLISGLTLEELTTFISAFASQIHSEKTIESSEHLRLGQVDLPQSDEGNSSDNPKQISFEELPAEELARFTEIYELLKNRKKLKIHGLGEIVSAFIDTIHQEGETRLVMAALRSSELYDFTHAANVCILNLVQSMELGIEGKLLHDIGIAAMLHDIGKLSLPEEILTTTKPLTDQEFDLMREHPANGARQLLETPGIPRLAVITAYEHHMRYDLSGYPHAPQGWQPNLSSQMTMISDFFDAMRTRRSYRKPLDLKTVVLMMRHKSGTEFHPLLTRNFLNILKRVIIASRSDVTPPPQPAPRESQKTSDSEHGQLDPDENDGHI